MCGRYVSSTQSEMERYWGLTDSQVRNPLAQRINVSPTMTVPMIYRTEENLCLAPARWGLAPFWWNVAKLPNRTFNVRSEEVGTQAMWRRPASSSRCLVPALGWYEWKEVERIDPGTGELRLARQPYLIQRTDREPIAFAGLMSGRNLEGGTPEFTYTILTRDAVGATAAIHARMPIVLPKEAESAWLDPEMTDAATVIDFARDNAMTDFTLFPFSPRVKDSRNEGVELIERFDNPA
jgi:putative SOS response-associated peptidase YedK